MAKKTSRSRRDPRSRLSESQLQAYRVRKAETVVTQPVQSEPTAAQRQSVSTQPTAAWGHVDEEYSMIRSDLYRLLAITVLMFAVIIVLWFMLG